MRRDRQADPRPEDGLLIGLARPRASSLGLCALLLAVAAPARADVALVPLEHGALVVWGDGTGIHALPVDESGQPQGEARAVLSCGPEAERIAAVRTPSGAAVVFARGGRTWLQRIGPDGNPSAPVARIFDAAPRPPTASSIGGTIGMLARPDAGPVVGSPAQGAIAALVGTSVDEGPQLLLVRWEGVPVLGPALPWHSGAGEAVLGTREGEVAAVSASSEGVFLTRIGLDARAIGVPHRLSPDDGIAATRPSIVGAGDRYLVAWHAADVAHAVVVQVGADGVTVTPRVPGRAEPALGSAVVATAGDRHVLVGRAGDDLVVVRFGDRGRSTGRPTVVRGALAGSAAAPLAAAFVGRRLLVAIAAPGAPPRVLAVD